MNEVMDTSRRERLKAAYRSMAAEREIRVLPEWKLAERRRFLGQMRDDGATSLLEAGSGPGVDAVYFRDHGLDVVCVDLSPEMVASCRDKGLTAHEMDLVDLRLPPGSFDAVYALNCLLHVPKAELPLALGEIWKVLAPGGLFYLGVYGGIDSEGEWEHDTHEPKRFFSFHTDGGLRAEVERVFDVVSFRRIDVGASDPWFHFQSFILRKQAILTDTKDMGRRSDGI
ncbi:class I SAM-dependent methyltransferase [Candidatus Bipolaricaulota bacterium]